MGAGPEPVPLRADLPAGRARAPADRAARARRRPGRARRPSSSASRTPATACARGSGGRTASRRLRGRLPRRLRRRAFAPCARRSAIGFPGRHLRRISSTSPTSRRAAPVDERRAARRARRRRLPGRLPAEGRRARAPHRHRARRTPRQRHERCPGTTSSTRVIERMRIDVERVNWFSTYRVHHRVAERSARAAPSCSATPRTSTAPSAARG